MAVSVIVSNFNGAKYLPRLLQTLVEQKGVAFEIIVVDRKSTDDSAAILSKYPQVIVATEPPESGLVSGYAVGVPLAKYENLFFCNEDMWFDGQCLQQLDQAINLDKKIGAADPWQWTYDGKTWIHGGVRFREARLNPGCPHAFRRYDFTVPLTTGDLTPIACAGAVLMARKMYDDLGGWDREFFLDHEDVDLFLRAWWSGWQCVTVPAARVYHAVNVSNDKTISQGRMKVGKRRYISSQSNIYTVAAKYFSLSYWALQMTIMLGRPFYHLGALRLKEGWWDLLGIWDFLSRLPKAWRFRGRNREIIRQRPGESFYSDKRFYHE
jgi:GT2 family glycosyltransferase